MQTHAKTLFAVPMLEKAKPLLAVPEIAHMLCMSYACEEWMLDIMTSCMKLCGLASHEWPNSCNLNLYLAPQLHPVCGHVYPRFSKCEVHDKEQQPSGQLSILSVNVGMLRCLHRAITACCLVCCSYVSLEVASIAAVWANQLKQMPTAI